MGGRYPDIGVARVTQQLPQHVAKSRHGIHGQTIGFAVERRNGVEGAENEARAIDEEEMITIFHAGMDSLRHARGPDRVACFSLRDAVPGVTETLPICNGPGETIPLKSRI